MSEIRLYEPGLSSAGEAPSKALGGISKRIFDCASAFALIVLLAPLIIMIALLIVSVDGRPFFIRHKRIGHRGAEFWCFKFRTMVTNADEMLAEHLKRNPSAAAQWQARGATSRRTSGSSSSCARGSHPPRTTCWAYPAT